jgi:prepilin-type N-terminal cleavage/methylation domain-containing protein
MKLNPDSDSQGFTLAEIMVAVAVSSVVLAIIFTASIALQKSFNAVDNYFYTNLQQVRIIDYLSRDVKRSYIVHTTVSPQTVTCTIPNYVIRSGDSDWNGIAAGTSGSNVDTRRAPIVTYTSNGIAVDYGRWVSDGVTTSGSATLTSATANFKPADVGASLTGTGIPTTTQTTIQAYTNSTTVTMSATATASTTGNSVKIVPQSTVVYSINGNSILRTENGAVTTIASATDQLVPSNTDVEATNSEFLTSNVTFLPIFTNNNVSVERSGTTVFATSYLRNLRRGN